MKTEKISIIVSAYNTEKYIGKCIESILNQTYSNIELIIVNDASTDNTLNIIKKYQKKDSRINLINNIENKGLSYSRNIALKQSSGDYVGYIDSDDYIESNYYKSLLESLKKDNDDISICDINLVYENTNNINRVKCGSKESRLDFINNGLAASVCNKLFKRNVIETYIFSEGKVNEDLAVTLPLLMKNKLVYNEEVTYNYVQRNDSIQNSEITEKRFDIFDGVSLTIERIGNDKKNKMYIDSIVFQQIILLLIYVIPKEKKFFKRIKWLRQYSKLSYKYDIKNNSNLKDFLNNQPKLTKYYYKILILLNCYKMNFLASVVINLLDFYKKYFKKNIIKNDITIDLLIKYAIKQKNMKDQSVKISVVVPNYNYERFLLERLYSIISQTYKISEIIILDDCSKDDSKTLIDNIVNKLNKYINIKAIYNDKNSGSAFKQWKKGFDMASGDYVWIAEADDYCNKKLLKNLVNPILQDNDIIISYADTAFINAEGRIIVKSIIPEIDIMKTGHWNNNYIIDGAEEYNNYSFLNCTIANVSSCIIKKDNYDKEFELSGKLKQAGDWLLYVNIMHKGKIAYTNKPLNYYRLHGDNVSSTFNYEKHLEEIKFIHNYYRNKYGLNELQEKEINKRYSFLRKVWNLKNNSK